MSDDRGSEGRRSVRRVLRVTALIGFCAVSWGAGAALLAGPVAASTCLPNGSTCPPDDFTGSPAGTLLASLSGPFSASGSFSGSYLNAVYLTAGGTLTFLLQVSNDPGSADALTQLGMSHFQGVLGDMGDRSDGSSITGTSFVDGTQIPTGVTRGTTGDPVSWDFSGPGASNTLPPGTTSLVLVVETNATTFTSGTLSFNGGAATSAGFEPVVTQMSSAASPKSARTGTTLQDSATLAATHTLSGTGSITFNLYGPGDTACSTPIHTETVTSITSDGPWTTTTGYLAGSPGTYNWIASFSGDTNNEVGSTACGDEPVVVTRISQITPAAVTCSQYAASTAPSMSQVFYSVHNGKIAAVAPHLFSYWAAVTSTGGTQTFTVDQFTNETSRPFRLAPGSSVFTAACSSMGALMTQSGGVVTVTFGGGIAGTTFFIGLNFSTSNVVGESRPMPSSTVRYLFQHGGSSRELDLVK